MFVVAAPARAKSSDDYQVSCNDLWAAVKATLDNPDNYGILSLNDTVQKASFTVVGGLTTDTDKVALTPKDSGCGMRTMFIQLGPDNSDWRQFHHRIARSLAKMQAAKPKPVVTATGQQ